MVGIDTALDLRSAFAQPIWQNPQLVVGCDDGASLDFAVVKELVGLVCAVDRKVFDEHLDLSRLGELDDFYQLGDGAPKR